MEFDFEEAFNSEEYLYFFKEDLVERVKKEIDFLVKYTELNQPLEILDLACGHGRHANALAKLGHKVTGADNNKGFLEVAKSDAQALNVLVNYKHQDMRTLANDPSYDRIFVLFTAIGYFDDEQNETVFRNIFKALKPNGIFCFDSHNRDTFLTYFKPSSVMEKDGNFVLDQKTFDSLTGRCVIKRTVIYNQSIKSFPFTLRFYNPTEIMKLLKQIGFSSIEFFENWEGKLLSYESKRMIVIARK